VEHYGCLVDVLGQSGKLKEAYEIVKNMPEEPNEVIWGSLELAECMLMRKCQDW
jgi:pentatricopeptide repeat protein